MISQIFAFKSSYISYTYVFEHEGAAAAALPNLGVTSSRRLTTSLTKVLSDIVGDF